MDSNNLSELFKTMPELSNLFPSLKTLLTSAYQYQNALDLQKGYQYIQQLKSSLNSSITLEKIKKICEQSPEQCKNVCDKFYEYCSTNTNNLENASTVCSKLDELYMAQVRSLGYLMIGNAVLSLGQSLKAWFSVYQFQIPDYKDELAEAAVYIDRSAEKLKPMLETEKTNLDDLNRIDDWLLSAHNILERIRRDLEKKIDEARKLRSTNFLSAIVNATSVAANFLSYQAIATSVVDSTFKALTVSASAIHGVCTIGDLIATGKANQLVSELKTELAVVRDLQVQRQKLAAQVRTLR